MSRVIRDWGVCPRTSGTHCLGLGVSATSIDRHACVDRDTVRLTTVGFELDMYIKAAIKAQTNSRHHHKSKQDNRTAITPACIKNPSPQYGFQKTNNVTVRGDTGNM